MICLRYSPNRRDFCPTANGAYARQRLQDGTVNAQPMRGPAFVIPQHRFTIDTSVSGRLRLNSRDLTLTMCAFVNSGEVWIAMSAAMVRIRSCWFAMVSQSGIGSAGLQGGRTLISL